MMLPTLLSQAWAADVETVEVATLGTRGEAIGGGHIVRIERHPEFERYWVADPAGLELPIEVVIGDGVHEGLCENGPLVLYPRYELATGKPAIDPQPFCDRLAKEPPRLTRVATPLVELPPTMSSVTEGAGHVSTRFAIFVVAALAAMTTLGTAWRARAAAHWGLLATVAAAGLGRALVGHATLFNGAGAGYEKLVLAWGDENGSPYGEGFPVLMAPFVAALGRTPDAVFVGNTVYHLLAAAAFWALVRGELGARIATLAGLSWALLPVPAWIAASEAMHVSVELLVVAALACAGAWRRGHTLGGVAAALLTTLAVNTRPETLPLAVIVVLWAWPRRGWLPALILVGAVVSRVVLLRGDQSVVDPWKLTDPSVLVQLLIPHLGDVPARVNQQFWVRIFTPVVLWPLAILGIREAGRGLRLRLFAWIVGLGLLVAVKAWPLADAMRLQTPVLFAWAIFAGIGAASLPRWGPWIVLGAALTRPTLPRWPQAEEFDFLREIAPTLKVDVVRFDASWHRAEKMQVVLDALGPARWSGVAGEASYRGLSCFGEAPGPNCRVQGCPAVVRHLGPESDLDLTLPPEGVDIGIWAPCPLLVQ